MRAHVLLPPIVAIAFLAGMAACSDDETIASRPPLPEASVVDSPVADSSVADADAATDAPVDAGPRCNPTAPFDAPKRVDELSAMAANEWAGHVSADEKLFVFTREGAGQQILISTRANADATWGLPTVVDGPWSTTKAGDPMIANLEGQPNLFFMYDVIGEGWNLARIPWNATTNTVIGTTLTPILPTTSSEVSPHYVEATHELWFLKEGIGPGSFTLQRSVATGTTFGASAPDAVLASSATFRKNGSIAFTADGLTAMFGGWPTGDAGDDTDVDVYIATRPSVAAAFGTPTAVPELNTKYFEQPLTLTPDGCRLYFASNRNPAGGVQTSIDLWVAQRKP